MVDSIKELFGLSRKLNQKSDTPNEVITSINEKLATLNLGVEAWVGYIQRGDPWYRDADDDQAFPLHDETWLGYYRFEKGWELAVKTVTVDADGGAAYVEGLTPLLSARRDIRVRAMKLIPELLNSIKKNAERLLQSIDEAEKAAQTLAGEALKLSLRKLGGERPLLGTGNTYPTGNTYHTGDTYQYEVEGLPKGQEAFIANFGRGNQPHWKIMRTINGVQGTWTGKHETPTHALAALQREVELGLMVD